METALVLANGQGLDGAAEDDLPDAELVVAANGGYDLALTLGLKVDVLVGDLDSLAAHDLPDHVAVERHPQDKDSTDLELALRLISERQPRRVVVVGGSGGRVDHELAAATLLCASWWDPATEVDWLSARGWIHVVRGRRTIHGDPGDLVTLLPMGGDAGGVTTKGLRWDLNDESLPHGTSRGVSNVLLEPVASIHVRQGCLLAVLPRGSS